MTIIYFGDNQYDDPNLALAVDEVLARNSGDNTYIQFYSIQPPSLVLAYRQHPDDINLETIRQKGIKIARRITPGGAIYCDSNSLLYSIVQPNRNPQEAFFEATARVISAMTGYDVYRFGYHSLFTKNDHKGIIAGSTKRRFDTNYLCQGMLTIGPWNSEILEAIVPRNQWDMIQYLQYIETDRDYLRDELLKEWVREKFVHIRPDERRCIILEAQKLAVEKYSTYDWTYKAKYNEREADIRRGFGFCYFTSLRERGGKIQIVVRNSELNR